MPEPGIWRFTFQSLVCCPGDVNSKAYVNILVDGQYAASAGANPPDGTVSNFAIAINSLLRLETDQVVTIVLDAYNGAYLCEDFYKYTHYTGTLFRISPTCIFSNTFLFFLQYNIMNKKHYPVYKSVISNILLASR